MHNRLPRHYFVSPSPGDRLLANAYGAKIELIRYKTDDGPEVGLSFELVGSITDGPEARRLLAALLESFQGPRPETDGAV